MDKDTVLGIIKRIKEKRELQVEIDTLSSVERYVNDSAVLDYHQLMREIEDHKSSKLGGLQAIYGNRVLEYLKNELKFVERY